ncbi:hypothetical protein AHF37_11366 [Paragonimus kellicotti]|nr:hypothetical protein AHF37_11366 [Paragonimus kellicotti]
MISLIASAVARMSSLEQSLISLIMFVATSAAYLALIALVVLPVFYLMVLRRNLFHVYAAITAPLLTAFSLTSSLIALPDLFKACDRLGVVPQVVRTIAPFLTSFNANGSAAFIASAVCFTAQVIGHPLNVAQLIGIGFLAGFNVMALPAVPSASLITVFLIIRVFSIPESAVSLLFVVEFIVDRLRTLVNVLSHGTCVMFVHLKTIGRGHQEFVCVLIDSTDCTTLSVPKELDGNSQPNGSLQNSPSCGMANNLPVALQPVCSHSEYLPKAVPWSFLRCVQIGFHPQKLSQSDVFR